MSEALIRLDGWSVDVVVVSQIFVTIFHELFIIETSLKDSQKVGRRHRGSKAENSRFNNNGGLDDLQDNLRDDLKNSPNDDLN